MPRGCPASPRPQHPVSRLTPLLIALLLVAILASGGGARATGDSFGQATLQAVPGPLVSNAALVVGRQDATDELPPLRTVGGASPRMTGQSEQGIRSQGGSLLAGSNSAWRDLTRAERATLLDADALWVPFDDLIAGDDVRDDLLFPVFEFAWDLSDGAEFDDDLLVNAVLLDLPAAKLGPALEESERQAVAIGPTVILLFDNVVVGRIDDAVDAAWAATIQQVKVDQRGLMVPPGTTTSAQASRPTATAQSSSPDSAQSATPTRTPRYSARGEVIPTVTLGELPIEAAETINLILSGGPFPFHRDGVTFGNYEQHLPDADFGYYREYTVITPGLDHRGARRIVTGENDTVFYYTDDHYESFAEVILPDD